MKILLTAFDPFGTDAQNAAEEAVKLVPERIGSAVIVKKTIPTVFFESLDVLRQTIEGEKPDAVLCIGQAAGRSTLTVERVAINLIDADIPDNKGVSPCDTPILQDGQNAYFSNLPIKEMVTYIRAAGIPANISNSAGTFVCNQLMYGLLALVDREFPTLKGGFLHVPLSSKQAAEKRSTLPSMSLSDIALGIQAALRAIIAHEERC